LGIVKSASVYKGKFNLKKQFKIFYLDVCTVQAFPQSALSHWFHTLFGRMNLGKTGFIRMDKYLLPTKLNRDGITKNNGGIKHLHQAMEMPI